MVNKLSYIEKSKALQKGVKMMYDRPLMNAAGGSVAVTVDGKTIRRPLVLIK